MPFPRKFYRGLSLVIYYCQLLLGYIRWSPDEMENEGRLKQKKYSKGPKLSWSTKLTKHMQERRFKRRAGWKRLARNRDGIYKWGKKNGEKEGASTVG